MVAVFLLGRSLAKCFNGSYKRVTVQLFDKTEQILSFCVMLHSGFKGEVDESLPSPRLRKHFQC